MASLQWAGWIGFGLFTLPIFFFWLKSIRANTLLKAENAELKKKVNIAHEQDKIDARPAASADDLLKRMRNGGL